MKVCEAVHELYLYRCGQSSVNRLFAGVLMCLRLTLVVYNRPVQVCTRRMDELSR